jgi:hypothetical protein
VSTVAHIDPELKQWLLDEKRVVRALRNGALTEMARCERAAAKRGWTADQALSYTKAALADYFDAELKMRKVSS